MPAELWGTRPKAVKQVTHLVHSRWLNLQYPWKSAPSHRRVPLGERAGNGQLAEPLLGRAPKFQIQPCSAGAMVGSAPNPRDGTGRDGGDRSRTCRQVPSPRARAGHRLPPPLAGAGARSPRAVETELVLLGGRAPGERHLALLSCGFSHVLPFSQQILGNLQLISGFFVVAVKDGRKGEDWEQELGLGSSWGVQVFYLDFSIFPYKKFYRHNCEMSSYKIFAGFFHLRFLV